MMPDLGKYALPVLASYGATLALLAGIVWTSWRRSRRMRAALRAAETRLRRANAPVPQAGKEVAADG